MQGVDPALCKLLPVIFLNRPGVLLAGFFIQRIPGWQAYLPYHVPFGQPQSQLLPENFVPHFIKCFLHKGASEVVCANPVALVDFVKFNNIPEAEMRDLLKNGILQRLETGEIFLGPGSAVQGCNLGSEADHFDQNAEFFLCEAKMHYPERSAERNHPTIWSASPQRRIPPRPAVRGLIRFPLMRALLIIFSLLALPGCFLFKKRSAGPYPVVPYPVVSFEQIHERAGGLQPRDHVALTKWDKKYYYFEWRRIVEPATLKTREGAGRVPVKEFDRKNGRALDRKYGILGKEDLNGQLYNAGAY